MQSVCSGSGSGSGSGSSSGSSSGCSSSSSGGSSSSSSKAAAAARVRRSEDAVHAMCAGGYRTTLLPHTSRRPPASYDPAWRATLRAQLEGVSQFVLLDQESTDNGSAVALRFAAAHPDVNLTVVPVHRHGVSNEQVSSARPS